MNNQAVEKSFEKSKDLWDERFHDSKLLQLGVDASKLLYELNQAMMMCAKFGIPVLLAKSRWRMVSIIHNNIPAICD